MTTDGRGLDDVPDNTREDYEQDFLCLGCGAVVTIRVPAMLRASEVIAAWQRDHGGRCGECIEAGKQEGGE